MSRASSTVSSIRKHLPRGRRLPSELRAFAKLVVSERGRQYDRMNLTWSNPRPLLNADRRALESLVPFARLGDGGVVAFWWDGTTAEPHVVHCDSEGQYAVIATSFPEFLARLAGPSPDFVERLELEAPIDTSALVDVPRRPPRIPESLRRKFHAWVESHSLSQPPDASADAHAIALQLQTVARRMLQDGLSKVYKTRDIHWTIELRVVRNATHWEVTYLDYGKWLRLPTRYELAALLPELVRLMKNPRRQRFDLSIWKDGHVFVDRGNQLTIEPR